MATNDDYDTLLAQLEALADEDAQHAAARRAIRGKAKKIAVLALEAGIAEERVGVRSEVQRKSPFSAPTIRELADAAGIPPDERYVRAPKQTAAAERAAENDASPDIDTLPLATAQRLAGLVEEDSDTPAGWVQRITAGVTMKQQPYAILKAALAEGYLRESQIRH